MNSLRFKSRLWSFDLNLDFKSVRINHDADPDPGSALEKMDPDILAELCESNGSGL